MQIRDSSSFRCPRVPFHPFVVLFLALTLLMSGCSKTEETDAVLVLGVTQMEAPYVGTEGDWKVNKQVGKDEFFLSLNTPLGRVVTNVAGSIKPEQTKDIVRLTVQSDHEVHIKLMHMQGIRVLPTHYMNALRGNQLTLKKGDHKLKISGTFHGVMRDPDDLLN